jgi:hypothetical protein
MRHHCTKRQKPKIRFEIFFTGRERKSALRLFAPSFGDQDPVGIALTQFLWKRRQKKKNKRYREIFARQVYT